MRTIYWHSYEQQNEGLVASAMTEFTSLLTQPPTEVAIGAKPFADAWASDILGILSRPQTIVDTCAEVGEFLSDQGIYDDTRILVMCSQSSPLAKAVRENNPDAKWGGSLGRLAVVWHEDRYVLWHEALHLINARDCYTGLKPDCDLSTCIMQYVPTRANVGDWPFLCSTNIGLLRTSEAQHREFISCQAAPLLPPRGDA